MMACHSVSTNSPTHDQSLLNSDSIGQERPLQYSGVDHLADQTSNLSVANNLNPSQRLSPSSVNTSQNTFDNVMNAERHATSTVGTYSHNLVQTQTVSNPSNVSNYPNQLRFNNFGQSNYSNVQYTSSPPGNAPVCHSPFATSAQFNANLTQARSPLYMNYDTQVRFTPPANWYHQNERPATSSHTAAQHALGSGDDGTNRHITCMHINLQPPHIANYNHPEPSAYLHSTSVNYALAPTPRQATSVPHYQPLHIVTESTGGGITAVSTNFRPSSPYGYQPNTTLPSPQPQFQQTYPYNTHGQNLNRMPYPQNVMTGATSAAAMHQFPPDVPSLGTEVEMSAPKQAFIQRQKSRLEHMSQKLTEEQMRLSNLRKDVNDKEIQLINKHDLSHMFPKEQLLDLPNLREQNRMLLVKCQCIAWEVDVHTVEKDGSQDFFSQLNTGPPLVSQSSSRQNRIERSSKHKTQKKIAQEPQVPHSCMQEDNVNNESREDGKQWNCVQCTFLNSHLMDKCEMCSMIRISNPVRDVHEN